MICTVRFLRAGVGEQYEKTIRFECVSALVLVFVGRELSETSSAAVLRQNVGLLAGCNPFALAVKV